MMNAVKAAVSALFDSTGGNVTVRFVPFASSAPLSSCVWRVFTTEGGCASTTRHVDCVASTQTAEPTIHCGDRND